MSKLLRLQLTYLVCGLILSYLISSYLAFEAVYKTLLYGVLFFLAFYSLKDINPILKRIEQFLPNNENDPDHYTRNGIKLSFIIIGIIAGVLGTTIFTSTMFLFFVIALILTTFIIYKSLFAG